MPTLNGNMPVVPFARVQVADFSTEKFAITSNEILEVVEDL